MSSFTDGLIGYWTFDGTTTDASGNGNTLALQGGATFGDGLFGQALSLDGQPSSYAVLRSNGPQIDGNWHERHCRVAGIDRPK
jgi:hypothetical protein